MEAIQESIAEYRIQMKKGIIPKAYKLIMDYVMQLKTYFQNKYAQYPVGNLYYGYMDMTYFPIFSSILKKNKLKIAIVFMHATCRFEAWLSGNNREIQKKYSNIVKEANWTKYRMDPNNPDSIIETTLVENPDFSDKEKLTKLIETSVLIFIRDIEGFLTKRK